METWKPLAHMLVLLICMNSWDIASATIEPTTMIPSDDVAFIKRFIVRMDEKIDILSADVVELSTKFEKCQLQLNEEQSRNQEKHSEKLEEDIEKHINFSSGLIIENLEMAKADMFEKAKDLRNQQSFEISDHLKNITGQLFQIKESNDLRQAALQGKLEKLEAKTKKGNRLLLAGINQLEQKITSSLIDVAENLKTFQQNFTEEQQLLAKFISNICNQSCEEGSSTPNVHFANGEIGPESTAPPDVNTTHKMPADTTVSAASNTEMVACTQMLNMDEVTFLNRVDGSVNFTKTWAEYQAGFGNTMGEFWLGLDCLHQITRSKRFGLRVDFGDFVGNVYQSNYRRIEVGPESEDYQLYLHGYSRSSGGDSLINRRFGGHTMINRASFSTIDYDNNGRRNNCAAQYGGGGWWWNDCGYAAPTGRYMTGGQITWKGMTWYSGKNNGYSYRFMKLTLVVDKDQ